MTLERDYEVCEAASDGEWQVRDIFHVEVKPEAKGFSSASITRRSEAGVYQPNDATYIAHFNPARVRKLLDRLRSAEEALRYAEGGLTEAGSQLARKGCWCPGAGDEECTLCIVRQVLHRSRSHFSQHTQDTEQEGNDD